jgi:hypothetical protein
MSYNMSKIAYQVLDKQRTYPIEVLADTPAQAKDISLMLANLRALDAGILIKAWPTHEIDKSYSIVMHSVHTEGYGAPIHVYRNEDKSREIALERYTIWDGMRDAFALGRQKLLKDQRGSYE